MRVVGVIQARASSSRLPGKVLADVIGEPMLARMIERVKRSECMDELVVATSTDPTDDAVEQLCSTVGVKCYRGSLENVLDRFYQAVCSVGADVVVRLTGDCPLMDPSVVDRVIKVFLNHAADYVSNISPPTFPDGLDVEVFSFRALEVSVKEADRLSEREHVTPFIRNRPDRFSQINVEGDVDLSGMRWTVDEPEDLTFVRRIYEALYPASAAFTVNDVLALLEARPELADINTGFQRNEGLAKTIEEEGQINEQK